MKKLLARPFLVTMLALALATLLSFIVGSVIIPPAAMWAVIRDTLGGVELADGLKPYATILFTLRLPRTVLVALTGAALAGSGAAYQGLFRNPLADPYLIGVASGAGLGAVMAMTLGWNSTLLGLFAVPLAALLGALLTVTLVYRLARVGRAVPVTNLILAGVAVSSFATALTSFLMILATGEMRRALVWLLGGSTLSGWLPVLAELPYVLIGLAVLFLVSHTLNVLQVGEEQAQQLGLSVEQVRLVVVVAASLASAAAVAFSGVIGFVGLVAPHVVRLVWGNDYRKILPLASILGAALLLFADIVARFVLAPQEIPVGIVMSLVGAPFFLWLLRRARQQQVW